MTIRYGIIGCGSIARFHFAALEKIGADIVHIADVDAEKGEALARRYGARFSRDWRQLLEDPEVTAVSVLVPSTLHRDICLEAAAAGKDVFCEKTLADGARDAYDIATAALKSGNLFMTGFMKRFFPAARKAKELMPSLGVLFSAQARSYQPWGDLFSTGDPGPYEWVIERYGGAILKCAGSHILDLIMHLVGRPESVSADIDYIPGSMVDRRATALLSYPGSLAVQFEASVHPLSRIGYERNAWDEWLEINGTEGRLNLYTVMWDSPENNAALLVHYDNRLQTSTEYRFPAMNPFDTEIAAFHRAMEDRQAIRPDVIDGFNVDVLISAIEEADRTGQHLVIDWRGL